MIATRANKFLSEQPPLVKAHFICAKDPFNEDSNLNGYINLGTAENYLMDDFILEKIKLVSKDLNFGFHYDFPQGSIELRKSYCGFLDRFFEIKEAKEDNIVFTSGASATIEILSNTLCENGEEILILSPLYNGFYHDIEARFDAKIVTSNCINNNEINFEQLESDIKTATKLKAFLVNNPQNPTGACLSKSTIQRVIEICKKYKLEIIADEIYANSIHGDSEFFSFLNPCFDKLDFKNHIHHVYGLAKDFCLSGLKVGVFTTFNDELAKAIAAQSYFYTVSTQTQKLAFELFSDLDWCDDLFKENSKRLKLSFNRVKVAFQKHGIAIFPSTAGIFIWADFSSFLKITSFEDERAVYKMFLEKHKFNITPGEAFASEKPGMFRICYAKSDATLDHFLKRISKLF